MRKFLLIVYCQVYGLFKDDVQATGICSLFLAFNVMTLYTLYVHLIDNRFFHLVAPKMAFGFPKLYYIGAFLIIGAIFKIWILRGEKPNVVYEEYRMEPTNLKYGKLLSISYAIFSFLFAFIEVLFV